MVEVLRTGRPQRPRRRVQTRLHSFGLHLRYELVLKRDKSVVIRRGQLLFFGMHSAWAMRMSTPRKRGDHRTPYKN